MDKHRNLLCVLPKLPSAIEDIEKHLAGWKIKYVKSLKQAQVELHANAYQVGIIGIDTNVHPAPEYSAFFRHDSQIQWIGICEKEILNRNEYQELIVEHMCDYHTLPIDYARLKTTIGHAYGRAQIQSSNWQTLPCEYPSGPVLIGNSNAIRDLRNQIDRVSRVSASVLISGETGTGKEIAAQSIHALSPRSRFPFIPINCASLSPTLIQSLLFGYERGAFTGAQDSKPGLLEAADKGTLFLDEIADLPIEMQANLLRCLQEKSVRRLGGQKEIPIDVRVIAASHVDLENAVSAKTFRQDLYYRLAVIPIRVPTLRERSADIRALSEYFYRLFKHEKATKIVGFSNESVDAMMNYPWPGNVRELINCIRRALALADGKLIRPADLGLSTYQKHSDPIVLQELHNKNKRQIISQSLRRSNDNISRAARELQMSRSNLYRLIKKLEITPGSKKL
jgi:DNA-binding NtrC family response regulator